LKPPPESGPSLPRGETKGFIGPHQKVFVGKKRFVFVASHWHFYKTAPQQNRFGNSRQLPS
jgi:hypothetical protein